MVRLRPDAASYARVAYAHELQGQPGRGAARSCAWRPRPPAPHDAEVAGLAPRADREHPVADGTTSMTPRASSPRGARVPGPPGRPRLGWRGSRRRGATTRSARDVSGADDGGADAGAGGQHRRSPCANRRCTRRGGDVRASRGTEREGWKSEEPQPAALARLFAERGRRVEEAVTLAEQASRTRSDIFTNDALAWDRTSAAGRIPEAHAASVSGAPDGHRRPQDLCVTRRPSIVAVLATRPQP